MTNERVTRGWAALLIAAILMILTAVALPAQAFTTLLNLDWTNGADPEGPLLQGTDGNFYGTMYEGGAYGYGTAFKITPDGVLTTLYSFCAQANCADGAYPFGGLIQATDGNFYGTAFDGGSSEFCCGTVFKITPGGTFTRLYSFCAQTNCTDGAYPQGGLVQATDGNFYGTTYGYGVYGYGTVFKITPGGAPTTLYSFCAQTNCADGSNPNGGLIQASDGNFYGTTANGGAQYRALANLGTVFRITPIGTLTTRHSFHFADGSHPFAGLVQAADGTFYGTTYEGGYGGNVNCLRFGCGTVFNITSGGTLTTLHTFDSRHGGFPLAALIQMPDGNFYGTTQNGSNDACFGGCGTIFKITPTGRLTTLHSFDGSDGNYPDFPLAQGTDGIIYGTTQEGANDICSGGCGTLFSLRGKFAPLVETKPAFGNVGKAIGILGNNLTGTTSVTFNGTAAEFTVVSDFEITTTVPAGASRGSVEVASPGGTLMSNEPFQVVP
jgi:uncharacterized repeat protein (TIGR03803 family)